MQEDLNANKVVLPAPRWIENGHIFLWLIKDTCWATVWKPGGIIMIFPTLTVAYYILWKSRHNRSEFFHNLAVCIWIMANSVWMVTEFMGIDKDYKKYAVYLFFSGIILLVIYYLFFFKKDQQQARQNTGSE